MTQKIAVAMIHGVGTQDKNFAAEMQHQLEQRCQSVCATDIVIQPVFWADLLDGVEAELLSRLRQGGRMSYPWARAFLIDFVGDAFAYQITDTDRHVYDSIHRVFALALRDLARQAGEDAPLCIIAHSLGSVIASNFIYDLQLDPTRHLISDEVREVMGDTPLEHGQTLALLYTMGSPLALWSLRYHQFGMPIQVPDLHLKQRYPAICGEWVNFYDAADVIASPIKTINNAYKAVVTEDREVSVGNLLTSWNPLSHLFYWTDDDVLKPIADKLIEVWKAVNPAVV